MDMDAIAINSSNVFCSPACARDFLDSTTEEVEYIILHDSQRVLDAAVFSHHTDDGDILMFVDGIEEARITVDEIGENFPHEFRPKP
ncbi:hypothetical protein G9C82_17220 [Haloarcula sp. R1-2]|nr:hypothetical protein [Haloarcula sp. R1-2]